MSAETVRVLTGDCTVRFEPGDGSAREERGAVLAVVKPDDTVLVHDRAGYRPAAWLTRADDVWTRNDDNGAVIEAADGERRLLVTGNAGQPLTTHRVTGAGDPIGACPDCDGPLIRTARAVECLDCAARHGIPRDATLLETECETCGLPTMRVERGAAFELCVDRDCEPLDDRVREAFDGAWDCPSCESPLRILRRNSLIAGCDAYPDCDTAFQVPTGVVAGECDECGLPAFVTGSGRRCLDATCAGP